jgi:tRNA uridine 5-carboxymethylaminomethyl modification enzyme
MVQSFDVIVVGGGHAGCEAACASARRGALTALITLDAQRIGVLSCNPAVGGLAKGQLVKEVDALGGMMARVSDLAAIQYRQLNESKGPAVRASRVQCDKDAYPRVMQEVLSKQAGLQVLEGEVSELWMERGKLQGLLLRGGGRLLARAVVITSGTFLKGVMHCGELQTAGGRCGDKTSDLLSDALKNLGFALRRLKTGTPPRLWKNSVNFSKLEVQEGDPCPKPLSFFVRPHPFPYLRQVSCFLTYTNEETHDCIREDMHRSPMLTGAIQGVGPRYCPSIEDKVRRFPERDRHQIFIEPEGLNSEELYINGVSTSLPRDAQEKFIQSIQGFELARFARFGYAVEYDCVDARGLKQTLEAREVPGLFFAGQVNGTSGYEEAAAQGLLAGANAAAKAKDLDPLLVGRQEAYLGVMVDDLVLRGIDEPYRMFTSRAEFRLLLREDNASRRLAEKAHRAGLLSSLEYDLVCQKEAHIQDKLKVLSSTWVRHPEKEGKILAEAYLRRPEVSVKDLVEAEIISFEDPFVAEQVEIEIKYAGYIKRDLELLASVKAHESLTLPEDLDFEGVAGLSNEIRNRLRAARPETLGQVSRIQGVTPAAVASLFVHLKIRAQDRAVAGLA